MNTIANGESGLSVRTKLNTLIALATSSTVCKVADAARATAAANDDEMRVVVEAGQTYLVHFSLAFTGTNASDAPGLAWDLPAYTGNYELVLKKMSTIDSGAVTLGLASYVSTNMPTNAWLISPDENWSMLVEGWLRVTPSAAGYVTLKWGNAPTAGTTTFKAGSWIQLVPATDLV